MTFIIHKNLNNQFHNFLVKNCKRVLNALHGIHNKILTYTELHFAVISLWSISELEIISLDCAPVEKSEWWNIHNNFQTTLNGHQKAREEIRNLVTTLSIKSEKIKWWQMIQKWIKVNVMRTAREKVFCFFATMIVSTTHRKHLLLDSSFNFTFTIILISISTAKARKQMLILSVSLDFSNPARLLYLAA